MKNTSSIFVRFKLLTWLGAFFCFLLVPAVLINEGLDSILQLRSENERSHLFKQMDDRLSFLTRYADESHYYHSLLKTAFNRACKSHKPLQSIEKSITTLRQRFPGALRFIVWDNKKQIVDELTDEKSYRYIVSNLQPFFSEIAEHCRGNYPGEPALLQIVEKRLNLFRSYLGRFMVPDHLRMPFQAGEHGRCILADSPDGYPLFWFHSNENLTLFCSIKTSLHKNPGVYHAVEILNNSDSAIISGFISMSDLGQSIGQINDNEQRQLLIELGKYENAGLSHRQTDDYLMAFKLLSPELRGFCLTHKRQMSLGYPEQRKAEILARLITAILITLGVFYCYTLRLPRLNFSIRTRMAFLFLYANGLPLMTLGTIGYEYLQQRESALLGEAHTKNERILQEIDAGYRRHKMAMNRSTMAELEELTQDVKTRLPDKRDQERIKKIVHALGAEEIIIYGEDGDAIISYKRDRKLSGQAFMRMFAASTLGFANKSDDVTNQPREIATKTGIAVTSNSIVNDHRSLLENILNTLESVEIYSFGTDLKLCFARLLGNPEARHFHSVLILTWRVETAQAGYAAQQITLANKGQADTIFAAMSASTGQIYTKSGLNEEKLRPLMQKALNIQSAHENYLKINGQMCLVTAIAGRQMDGIALAAITPTTHIAHNIESTRFQMLALVLLSIMIISAVVTALSKQFLRPVRQLAEAVRQIGQRNFSYRTSINSPDEFGELGKVFNMTMEGMAELEIGRVVQEALLPASDYQNNRLRIFAKTVTMTKLGGDYFDYLKLSDHQTGVFMGDVAGHGIPAAIIMAMAKATVLVNRPLLTDPAGLLTTLHEMLFKLKSDGFKRMMTCQYLVIDDQSGEILIANAGHCYPVIVGKNGCSSRMEEIIGIPVGVARRARYQNRQIHLQPGETLILYSDGLIEATSATGEVFGPDMLIEQVITLWSSDLEQYYQNLFQANRAWIKAVDDDLTIVLIKYEEGVADA